MKMVDVDSGCLFDFLYELAKVVLEELEEQLEDVYVPNDGNFNGISDNHESIISITKSAYPVNRSDIYGNTDHFFAALISTGTFNVFTILCQ